VKGNLDISSADLISAGSKPISLNLAEYHGDFAACAALRFSASDCHCVSSSRDIHSKRLPILSANSLMSRPLVDVPCKHSVMESYS
jgi:hypothetical protein